MERNEQLEVAEKALTDYISSLDPEIRVKMQAFQNQLVEDAKTDPAGMVGVIIKNLSRLQGELLDACRGMQEVSAEHIASVAIDKIRYGR